MATVLPNDHVVNSSSSSSSENGQSEYRIIEVDTSSQPDVPRVLVSWENINYSVETKKGEEKILKDLSGFANPGEILAIMGSSGAGKTSLLNILAGRTTSSSYQSVNGSIYANGVPTNQVPFGDFSAYVTQQDILLPVLTPQEAITFSAKLRCKESDVSEKVQRILSDLKLERIAHNKIGSVEQKGISGGERKRVCIAVELVSDPSVLFLDEPTSGLDAYTAEILFKLLIKQARKGRTIITTIHQPSSGMFEKFQRLILMSEGSIIYQGNANESVEYFSSLGYPCPAEINPADYFMKMLHVVNRYEPTPEESEKLQKISSYYKSQEYKVYQAKKTEDLTDMQTLKTQQSKGLMMQTKELLIRAFRNASRNPALSVVKIMQSIAIAILIDLIFFDLDTDLEGVQSRSGLLFFIIISQGNFGSQNSTLACKF